MRLGKGPDLNVLRVMDDGETYNPVRVRYLLGESFDLAPDDLPTKSYTAQVMIRLRNYELLERVPPESSGLYRITNMGLASIEFAIDGEWDPSLVDLSRRAEEIADRGYRRPSVEEVEASKRRRKQEEEESAA